MAQNKITSSQIKDITAEQLTGVLTVEQGGTGANTKEAAINNLLPPQANKQNNILVTDGSNVDWIFPDFGTVKSVDVSGGTTGVTFTGGPITLSGTITMSGVLNVANGGTGKSSFTSGYIKSDGTQLTSSATIPGADITGDITGKASNVTGVVAIANGGTGQTSFTSGYIKSNGTALSSSTTILGSDVNGDITGKASNVTGTVAIANGGTGQTSFANGYIKQSVTGFVSSSTIPATDITGNIAGKAENVTGVVAIVNGGTGQTTGQAAINALVGTLVNNTVLRSDGSNITLSSVVLTSDVTGILPLANGGTGQSSFTSGYIKSNGTSLSSSATIPGADITGDIAGKSSNVTGVVAIANGGTGQTQFTSGYIKSDGTTLASSNTVNGADITGDITGKASNVTGIVAIANGGTGQSTQQSAINALSGTQTANTVLRSNGTNVTLSKVQLTTDVEGILPLTNGGTGKSSFASGYIKSDGTNLLSNATIPGSDITGNITGNAENVTGVVAIVNGGTGQTSFTSGYIKSDGTTLASSATIAGSDVTGDITGKASNVTGTVAIANGGTGQTQFASGYIKSDGSILSSNATIPGADIDGDITGKASNVTGIVAIANGGTGQTQFASGYVKSDGSSLLSIATINGADVTGDIAGKASNVTGVVAIQNGGTGQTSFTSGYIKSNGTALSSNSTIPGTDIDGDIAGNAENVTGIVAIENGGTGQTSFSTGYIKSDGTTLSSSFTIPGTDINGDITGKASNVTGVVAIENGGTNASDKVTALTNLLPDQTGFIGKALISGGPEGSTYWGNAPAAGIDNTIQYNVGGVLNGSSSFTWDNITRTLKIGNDNRTNTTFSYIIGATITNPTQGQTGGQIILKGGSQVGILSRQGGSVIIEGGDSDGFGGSVYLKTGRPRYDVPPGSPNGGSVFIHSAKNDQTGTGGDIVFKTGIETPSVSVLDERFRITNKGAWSLGFTGTSTGTTGQVLTSNGSDLPPSWQDSTGGGSEYTLPTATTTVLGGVKIDGETITIDDNGVISSASAYELPQATTTILGGVKVDGQTVIISNSGVITAIAGGTNGTYDIAFSLSGYVGSGNIFLLSATRTFTLPAGLLISKANCLVSPTDAVSIRMFKKDSANTTTQIGSINFAASATQGTFTLTNAVTFVTGDLIYFNIATPDMTFSDLAVTLAAVL